MTSLTSSAGVGGVLPETYAKLVIEPAIAAATITQPVVSTTVQTGSHQTNIPIIHDDVHGQWVAEGQEINPSDATFGEIQIVPAKCASLNLITNELADDSDPSAVQLIIDSIARDLAVNMDTAAFGALSSPAPSGLGALTGVSTVSAGSSWANLDAFTEAISTAQTFGAQVTSFVANPKTALAITQIREGKDSNRTLLTPDPTQPTRSLIAGAPLLVNNAVADGVVWAMPADRVMTVARKSATMTVSKDYAFSSDKTAVRGVMRVGFAFPSPKSIVKVSIASASGSSSGTGSESA